MTNEYEKIQGTGFGKPVFDTFQKDVMTSEKEESAYTPIPIKRNCGAGKGATHWMGCDCHEERHWKEIADLKSLVLGLFGAMPPALQKKWPNLAKRAQKIFNEEYRK